MKSFLLASLIALAFSSSSFAVNEIVVLRDEKNNFVGALSVTGVDHNAVKGYTELAPRGSASVTHSGALAKSGIKYIIHAAPGSMSGAGSVGEPTLEGVRLSIRNSIQLAEAMKLKSIAIPLIGGGIFLNRLHTTKEQLAKEIILAAVSTKTKIKVTFVAFAPEEYIDMSSAFKKGELETLINDLNIFKRVLNWFSELILNKSPYEKSKDPFFLSAKIVRGSIVDASVHNAEAIVNAANMELQFGAGLSGVIGDASEQSQQIDQINKDLITRYHAIKDAKK